MPQALGLSATNGRDLPVREVVLILRRYVVVESAGQAIRAWLLPREEALEAAPASRHLSSAG